jgi:hypothetical protein
MAVVIIKVYYYSSEHLSHYKVTGINSNEEYGGNSGENSGGVFAATKGTMVTIVKWHPLVLRYFPHVL